MAYVRIPSILKKLTAEKDRVQSEGKTIKEVVLNLFDNYPALKLYLLNESGQLSPFVSLYLNSRNVCISEEAITDQDELVIVPALQGG